MAIAGIEGLAQGFMQGMAIKRQNDRQDVLDAQNLERFSMDKERFATQQAASAFDLQNAQTNAANAATDRVRSLSIQKKGDDFEANLSNIYGAGTPEGELIALEAIHQGSGVKGAWARDPKTGSLAKSADGKFRWVNEDGTAYDASVEDAVGAYISKAKPLQKAESDMKTASEIAGENRKEKTTIAAEGRAAKTAATVAATLHSYKMSEKAQELLAAKLAKADATLDSKDLATFFSVPITVTDADGKIKISQQVNQENFTNYLQWTKKNKVGMTTNSFRDWRAEMPSSGATATTTSNTETYKSKSQGDLTVTGGLDKESGAVDMSGRSKLGSQGAAQPAVPKSLTIPRPVPTVSYENMPIKSVTKTATKQGRGGGRYTYQEVLATRDMPVPPEGFKRKSLSERDPNFNVFVSNNYQD